MHTLACNAHCQFCSNDKLSGKTSSKGYVFRIIDTVKDNGAVAIIFLGGESLVDPNLGDYIAYTKKNHLIPLLQTNGTLITNQKIQELRKAGLFSITITIHDSIAKKHDSVYGISGALDTTMKALPVLRDAGIEINFKTLYSHESVESGAFLRILSLAKKYNVFLNVNPIMPVGRGMNQKNMLTESQRIDYLLCTTKTPEITTHTKHQYDAQCPAGHQYLGILPTGEILPCYFIPISVGNIKDTSFALASRRAAELGIFKKGERSCVIAMDDLFFHKVIKPLYLSNLQLPVRAHENDFCALLIKQYFFERERRGSEK